MSDGAVRLGIWLSTEEHDPRALVAQARDAEAAGFPTAMISDHLQPWVRHQGQASHVWTVIGGISQATDAIEVGTGVVALLDRNDPINVAQAAATAAVMLEGRFFLGVGTGERLNEQPFGTRWPSPGERRERLIEGIEVIRSLWKDEPAVHRGEWWTVEHLRLMTLPASPPPIYVASSGRRSAALAGEHGDGLIAVEPNAQIVDVFHATGSADAPCLAQLHLSLADTDDAALDNAWEWWPNGAVAPTLLSELARPEHFEAIAAGTERDRISDTVVCATDADAVIGAIDRFVGAGYGTVYLHQIGPDQSRLLDMATTELLPHYGP
ncbi:MAG: TIGR03557 family F420-dependent LLM class oxidoreductase [Acidimicrobiia bacterium]|nr:TIGR03557 family F420-dependent LLM class oxidoreductase [Acidimicrobiia bacterium]